MKKKDREIFDLLMKEYPDARCELEHSTPFQLLLSTVLSAQTTDVQVNKTMLPLYEKYPEVTDWLDFSQSEIEDKIKTIGLYRTKAKNVYNLVRAIISDFNGEVPDNMEDLTKLPGVGRKTANVVLSNAFGVPAIAVDTHVFRLANRIGITDEKTVEKTEEALMKAFTKDRWVMAHHLLIFHGRRCCTARAPKCGQCPITQYCKYYKEEVRTPSKTSKAVKTDKTLKTTKSTKSVTASEETKKSKAPDSEKKSSIRKAPIKKSAEKKSVE